MQRLVDILRTPVSYIDDFKDRLIFLIYCSLFVLLFIYIYEPFGIDSWPNHNAFMEYFGLFGYSIVGVSVIAFSQFILRPLIGPSNFTYGTLILWESLELLMIIAVSFFLFKDPSEPFGPEFRVTLYFTLAIASIPYTTGFLLLSWLHQKRYVSIALNNKQISPNETVDTLMINDENGQMAIAIKATNFLYVKSADNYIEIHYIENEKEKVELVRNSLKGFISNINYDNILRIHRSYAVNTVNISSIRKSSRGYRIGMENIKEKTLPVSNSFKNDIEEYLLNEVE